MAPDGHDEPLHELRELAEPIRPDFLERVRRGIHRKTLTVHVIRLGWLAPAVVLLEYINLVTWALFGDPREDERKE